MSAATQLHPDYDPEQALGFYRDMKRIRAFEIRCAELYSAGHIRGFLHLYVGEEAVATGVCAALEPQDAVVATYREHGQALLRGITSDACMAEMYGKVEGCSRGRGGSMHLFDGPKRFYGGNAIVGGGLPLAAGLAWGDKRLGRDAVTVCFFGEGAAAEGEFHEALNLAALWRLPVLFCCENNGYAMGTALARAQATTSVATKALTYGLPAEAVDGMDVLAVYEAATRAVTAIRGGAGPWLLELRTYRFRAHSMFDAELYRDPEEVAWWKERGPIVRLGALLREGGHLDDAHEAVLDARIGDEMDACQAFAEGGTDEPVEELGRFVLAEEDAGFVPARSGEPEEMTYREAVKQAICAAFDADDRVFLVGEDVGAYGGCYAVTKGLLDRYGPERIVDAPLSESGFTGAGIGAAAAGAKPIVEVMTVNFSLLALDQILNTAATLRHMSGDQCSAPVVIRMATGAGKQLAAQHSHSLEGWYAHIPGLKVLAPATVQDARDMLAAALADPNPVLIFEHVLLYAATGTWDPSIPCDLTHAAIRREGADVSLITYGGSLPTCLAAADELEALGISAEVLDLRVLRPLDSAGILATVRKTRRAVVVDEGWRTGSLSAEIAAQIQEEAFYDLDAPVQRVCTAEVPIPYPRHLEQAALPSVSGVVEAALRVVKGAV